LCVDASELALAAADRLIVDANRAAAAARAAAVQAVAHCLHHFRVVAIRARAANAHAVGQHLAAAIAADEAALAAEAIIAATLNAAQAAVQSAAKILQARASGCVFANAINLAAVGGLFNPDGTTRALRRTGGRASRADTTFAASLRALFLQHCIGHSSTLCDFLRTYGSSNQRATGSISIFRTSDQQTIHRTVARDRIRGL
jgi:hypothetical protein